MGKADALTLEEYETYAASEYVKDFYYSSTAYLNGTEDFEPVSTETEDETDSEESKTDENQTGMPGMPGMGGMGGMFGGFSMTSTGDFTLVGYSGESAMTTFLDGTASVTEGTVFTEGEATYECIISEELAVFNDLAVGDTILVSNPNAEDETYELTITGLFVDESANETGFSMMGMGMTMSDPANKIYTSYGTLQAILDTSAEVSETVTDENTGREYETALNGTLSATYAFADVESYEAFAEAVYDMGLDESYTVSSSDVTAYENSLTPLYTLSTMAGYFLVVILVIGALILIVLNIFQVRERKYEIGGLTAMGMKKSRVAMQFLTEIFAVTLCAVMLGAMIGAVSSVPVTNKLLENQVTSGQNRLEQIETNFGRGEMQMPGNIPQQPEGGFGGFGNFGDFPGFLGVDAENAYVTEISSATDLTVVLQMMGIAVLLTLVSGAVSVLFVMRYEPLKILANRD
ncbi:MAG: ABC transporter permease [Clostridia bacterium]|nr:ABC transporter permease [Clostridia bacterium]